MTQTNAESPLRVSNHFQPCVNTTSPQPIKALSWMQDHEWKGMASESIYRVEPFMMGLGVENIYVC